MAKLSLAERTVDRRGELSSICSEVIQCPGCYQ